MIVVNWKEASDNDRGPYNERQIRNAAEMLNAIAYDIEHGSYKPGARNNIAVDVCCLCHVLRIDPVWVMNQSGLSQYQLEDFDERKAVIDEYLDMWDSECGGVFDKMFTDLSDIEGMPKSELVKVE